MGDNILLRLCLAAGASFLCLLWAVHLMESRNTIEPTAHSWKSLNNFVRTYMSQQKQRDPHINIPFMSLNNRPDSMASHTIGYELNPQSSTSTSNISSGTSPATKYLVTPSSYDGMIYMDWIGDSDDFGYINYKSLESLLTVYPRSSIVIHLIASNGAQYYKMGNLISKHFFQKYLKYGYNVQVKIKYTTFALQGKDADVAPLGAAYWNAQFLKCCTSERAADINKYRVVPTHMYFYLRFSELYKNGGMYSDFSWYHVQSIAPTLKNGSILNNTSGEGAVIHLSCYTNSNDNVDYITGDTDGVKAPCMYRSSALLRFEKDSPVLHCILSQYNDTESTLRRCIDQDTSTDGDLCVKQALSSCFVSTNTTNIHEYLSGITTISTSTIGAPVIWLGSSSFNGDWSLYTNHVVSQYIQSIPLPVPGPYYKPKLVKRDVNSNIPYIPYPLRVLRTVTTEEQHYIHLLNTHKTTHIPDRKTNTACSHFEYDATVALPDHMQNQAKLSCAPHFVIPGFMKAGTTYMFGTLITHPMLLNALKGVTFKETGCYGSQYTTLLKKNNVVRNSIASVYSNAFDAYLANIQTKHSSVKDTTNTSFISTQATQLQDTYKSGLHRLQSTINRYYNRMDCFPFVEAHENVRFGDGTVWYNSHKSIPASLLRDNPNMKVLFSIRNPVHRAESHHRFSYRTLARLYTGDLNEIVQYLLTNTTNQHYDGTSLVELRQQAEQILQTTDSTIKTDRIEKLVANFQQRAPGDKKYKMLNQYLKFGIYFVPIYYWYQKIPNKNMVVLPVETLQPHKLSEKVKLSYLYNLTSLARYNTIYHTHTTNTNAAGKDRAAVRAKYALKLDAARIVRDENQRIQMVQQLEEELQEREEKIARKKDVALNDEYLVQQYNRIFRFLELPEMTAITEADSHQTGDKDILPEHKLSQESKRLLEEYFKPFNLLLEEFLGESCHIGSDIQPEEMITVGFAIRQVAAFVCAGTLAWDYCRDPAVLGNFAIWTLLVHFAYFQLPLRSQALPYLHPASFIGACLMPVMYVLLWVWSPSLETLHMEQWDQSWKTVVVRAFLLNLAPLVFHILDITINRKHIVYEYKAKPKKLGLLWSFCSFPLLGLTFELFFPESEEMNDLKDIDRESFLKLNRIVCFVALLVSFSVLYILVLRKALFAKVNSGHNLAHQQTDRNSPRHTGSGSNANSPH